MRFGKKEVERVRRLASLQRNDVASNMLAAVAEDGVREPHSLMDYGPKLKELLEVKLKEQFSQYPNLKKTSQFGLLGFWVSLEDPAALEFVAEVLERGSSGEIRKLVRTLAGQDENAGIPFFENERFASALIQYLQGDEVVLELVEGLAKGEFRLSDSAVVEVLSDRNRIALRNRNMLHPKTSGRMRRWLKGEKEKYLVAEKLVARMSCLHYPYEIRLPSVDVNRLMILFTEQALEISGSPQFDAAEVDTYFSETMSDVARYLRFRVDESSRRELAELTFRINDFQSFLVLATDAEQEEVKLLFSRRESLGGIPTSFRRDHLGENKSLEDAFYKSLPNPVSGLESPFLVDVLVMRLATMEPEFARPMMLELMKEGIRIAFAECGKLWEGSDDLEVVTLLERRLQEIDSEISSEGSGRIAQMNLMNYEWPGAFASLKKVSPVAASRIPATWKRKFSPDMNAKVPPRPRPTIQELEVFFQRAGLKTRFENGASRISAEDIHETLDLNGRLAVVDEFASLESQCESLLNASLGVFEPDIYVEQDPDRSMRCWVDIAMDDCVYRFDILNDRWFRQLQLCDVFNHILERRRFEQRFIPASKRVIYFGSPSLFEGLKDRFGIEFEPGSKAYLALNGGDSK